MQTENRFFDDFAKFVNGAAGTLAGAGREAEGQVREKFKAWVGGDDFVSREEFETVKTLAQTAREEVEGLKARLAALEARPTT